MKMNRQIHEDEQASFTDHVSLARSPFLGRNISANGGNSDAVAPFIQARLAQAN